MNLKEPLLLGEGEDISCLTPFSSAVFGIFDDASGDPSLHIPCLRDPSRLVTDHREYPCDPSTRIDEDYQTILNFRDDFILCVEAEEGGHYDGFSSFLISMRSFLDAYFWRCAILTPTLLFIIMFWLAFSVFTGTLHLHHHQTSSGQGDNNSDIASQRRISVCHCAAKLSGIPLDGCETRDYLSQDTHYFKAVDWFVKDTGINITVPRDCSFSSDFGILYVLILLRESMSIQDASWYPVHSLRMVSDVCHTERHGWNRIHCDSHRVIRSVTLNYDNLKGSIPIEIKGLTNLTSLDLFTNEGLVGSVPSEIGLLTNLQRIFIHHSSLSGTLPSEIGQLSALEQLQIYDTNLNGSIPHEVCLLRHGKLQHLHASCAGDPPQIQCDHHTCCTSCKP